MSKKFHRIYTEYVQKAPNLKFFFSSSSVLLQHFFSSSSVLLQFFFSSSSVLQFFFSSSSERMVPIIF